MESDHNIDEFQPEINKEIKRLEQYIAYVLSEIEILNQEIAYIKSQLRTFTNQYLDELSSIFTQITSIDDCKLQQSNDNLNDSNIAYIQSDYLKPLYRTLLKKLHPDVNKNINLNLINILNHAYRNSDMHTLIKLEQTMLDNNYIINDYSYMCYLDDIYSYYNVILTKVRRTKEALLQSDDYKLYLKYMYGKIDNNIIIHGIEQENANQMNLKLRFIFEESH